MVTVGFRHGGLKSAERFAKRFASILTITSLVVYLWKLVGIAFVLIAKSEVLHWYS